MDGGEATCLSKPVEVFPSLNMKHIYPAFWWRLFVFQILKRVEKPKGENCHD